MSLRVSAQKRRTKESGSSGGFPGRSGTRRPAASFPRFEPMFGSFGGVEAPNAAAAAVSLSPLTWLTILSTSPGTPTFPATQHQRVTKLLAGPPNRPRTEPGRRRPHLAEPFVEDALGVEDLLPHRAQLLHVCPQPDNSPHAGRPRARAANQRRPRAEAERHFRSFKIKLAVAFVKNKTKQRIPRGSS